MWLPLCIRQIFDMVDERSREKCLKEIGLVQSLEHKNIIRYIDAFIENNELMLIFEYAEVRNGVIAMLSFTVWYSTLCGQVIRIVPSLIVLGW